MNVKSVIFLASLDYMASLFMVYYIWKDLESNFHNFIGIIA